MDAMYASLADRLTPALLRWAWQKTGSSSAAEDLVQEVWLQFFRTVHQEEANGRPVLEPEHLLWRVARFVWYRFLHQTVSHRALPLDEGLPDPADFSESLAERQEQEQRAQWVHAQVTRMNRLQREALVLYYIEQWPQKRIAGHLGISEGALRWHLHDVRQRLRKGATLMSQPERVYRPHNLHLGISGTAVPDMAVTRVSENLLMQNILLCCHQTPRTISEMSAMLGVAAPYLEHDAAWLTQQELLEEEQGRYGTTFFIMDSVLEKKLLDTIAGRKEEVSGFIARELIKREALIREIGFIGSDKPMNQLLWWLLYHCCSHLCWPISYPAAPIRPDGGKYNPRAFDRTDPAPDSLISGWAYNGSMSDGDYFWFGLYNFGNSEIERLMDAWSPAWKALRGLLDRLVAADFDPAIVTDEEQPLLGELVQKGFLRMDKGAPRPTFCVLTSAQHSRLHMEVFLPIVQAVNPRLESVVEDVRGVLRQAMPSRMHSMLELETAMAVRDTSFVTERLAFDDGLLYRPAEPRDGEFLTFVCIH